MSRIIFYKGKQKEFLDNVRREKELDWPGIANICGISQRSLRDWRKEKCYMKYETAQMLAKKTSIPLYTPKKILPEYWSTKKAAPLGAKKRYEIYGNPGTAEGRKRGGINSQRKFQENSGYAKIIRFKIRKPIKIPSESSKLAEFIGIILGDGGITANQLAVTFNRETDKQHSIYIQKLIKELFDVSSSILRRNSYKDKADNIVVYSRNLIDFLLKKDLRIGSKIRNLADIPAWIKDKKDYKIACVRGLMDTDGSFYPYRHRVNGKTYEDFAICFTNHSIPLLNSVYNILKELKFKPSRAKWRVYLYKKRDVAAYVANIGSNNPKHLLKYQIYMQNKERYGSGYNRAVLKTA